MILFWFGAASGFVVGLMGVLGIDYWIDRRNVGDPNVIPKFRSPKY